MGQQPTIKEDVVNELHKPARKNFKRRRVIIKSLNDLWQIDLVEMQPYAKFNKGYRYILVVINAFSKYVWTHPLKSKTGKDVALAMKAILEETKTPPKNIQSDFGKEFFNKEFKILMDAYNINHYSTFSNLKASIVERVNRTLKNIMWKRFSLQGNYKWLNLLNEVVLNYNNTIHKTIGLKPVEVNKNNEKKILKFAYTFPKIMDIRNRKFQKDDFVRISKYRGAFTKGYTPNWSNEIFQIREVRLTNPRVYLLKDEKYTEIQGGFYEDELQKVKHPNVHLIEKILRRRKGEVYVKWLGLDNSHNSWLPKTEILQ